MGMYNKYCNMIVQQCGKALSMFIFKGGGIHRESMLAAPRVLRFVIFKKVKRYIRCLKLMFNTKVVCGPKLSYCPFTGPCQVGGRRGSNAQTDTQIFGHIDSTNLGNN